MEQEDMKNKLALGRMEPSGVKVETNTNARQREGATPKAKLSNPLRPLYAGQIEQVGMSSEQASGVGGR